MSMCASETAARDSKLWRIAVEARDACAPVQPDSHMRRPLSLLSVLFLSAPLSAQSIKAVVSVPAAMKYIREQDLKRDLYVLAGDEMRGREAGTLDEIRASVWLADEMEKIGVTPHGDAGSWF